jgi:hypothetical protein
LSTRVLPTKTAVLRSFHPLARVAVFALLALVAAFLLVPRLRERGRIIAAIGFAEGEAPHLAAAAPAEADTPTEPVVAARERILLIGDSMVQNLVPRLADYCLENGHELIPAVWWGSTSMAWGSSSRLDQLLAEHKPTVVMVVLGSSELLTSDIERLGTVAVRNVLRKVGARPLVWIGPPNWRADSGINAVLARELGAGRFFRSAELALPREADGIHPTREGGDAWVESIVGWLAKESSVTMTLAVPTRKATPPRTKIFRSPFSPGKPAEGRVQPAVWRR